MPCAAVVVVAVHAVGTVAMSGTADRSKHVCPELFTRPMTDILDKRLNLDARRSVTTETLPPKSRNAACIFGTCIWSKVHTYRRKAR
jgi:hypothetical protein